MNDLTPLARRFRAARDAADTSNRKIAEAIGISSPTVDRLMNGEGRAKPENIDLVADHLGISIREARELAGLPPGEQGAYEPPEESRLLDARQRAALDELIRSFVAMPRIPSAEASVTDIGTKRRVPADNDEAPPGVDLADAARRGDSVGVAMEQAQTAAAEAPDPPAPDQENESEQSVADGLHAEQTGREV